MLMTHKQKPSLKDCDIVAKSLVEKYDFMADTGSSDGDGRVRYYLVVYKWDDM